VGFALGDRGLSTAKVLQQQLPQAPHIQYCTDQHRPYCSIVNAAQHTRSKAHTHHIESMNNKLRWYLARLARKTHAYSKSATALLHALLFVWSRKFGAELGNLCISPQRMCLHMRAGCGSIPAYAAI
jgi:Transposase and inactivated derivatives, IS1 family